MHRGILLLFAACSFALAAPTPTKKDASVDDATLAKLTQSNQDLIDLLKKQQAVLEDIQYDRRLQNRQISSLEERLADALAQNAQMQSKVARLEAKIAVMPAAPVSVSAPPPPTLPATPPVTNAPPASTLPPAQSGGPPGTKWWHRLFTLSGTDAKNSDPFHIEGRQWRVIWRNQDKPGPSFANTSALFINAFPKNDTVPQKICSKLGTGGDTTELDGPGNFTIKVEASGGSWELAVEDFK